MPCATWPGEGGRFQLPVELPTGSLGTRGQRDLDKRALLRSGCRKHRKDQALLTVAAELTAAPLKQKAH